MKRLDLYILGGQIKRTKRIWFGKESSSFPDEIILKNEVVFVVGNGATVYCILYKLMCRFDLSILPEEMVLADFLAQRNLNCNLSRFEIVDGKLHSAALFDAAYLDGG